MCVRMAKMTSKRNTATDPVSNLRLELLQMNMCGNDVVYKEVCKHVIMHVNSFVFSVSKYFVVETQEGEEAPEFYDDWNDYEETERME